MPKFNLKTFGKLALTVSGVMIPQIAQAEEAFKEIKSGPDKKKAVLEAVKASVELSEVLSGQEIADVDLLMEGLSEMNDAHVKILKSIRQRE